MKSIVGVEPVSYVNKQGVPVSGVRIFVSSPAVPPAIGSVITESFISGGNMKDYPLGDVLAVLYEPTRSGYSRCTGVIYAKPSEQDKACK